MGKSEVGRSVSLCICFVCKLCGLCEFLQLLLLPPPIQDCLLLDPKESTKYITYA